MKIKDSLAKWLLPIAAGIIAGGIVVISSNFIIGLIKNPEVKVPEIKVYVRGEINSPGLYTLKADMRLCELIEKAGGTTQNADMDKLNLAAFLTDGTTVIIPAVGEETEVNTDGVYLPENTETTSSAMDKITSGTVNINTASASELMTLPGIGQATADKIVAYRTENGNFLSIEEIMNVSGIGEKKFESMKPYLAVE